MKGTAAVAEKRNKDGKLALIGEIRRELAAMTEEERTRALRMLQAEFKREQRERLGLRV